MLLPIIKEREYRFKLALRMGLPIFALIIAFVSLSPYIETLFFSKKQIIGTTGKYDINNYNNSSISLRVSYMKHINLF
jgi:hypothetical protein